METGRRRNLTLPLYLFALVLSPGFIGSTGCSSSQAWFPHREGNRLAYLMKTATSARVVVLQVGKPERHAGLSLYRLSGEGQWLVGWDKDRLMVAELPSLRLDPPLCLLQPSPTRKTWDYEGYGYDFEGRIRLQATISQEPYPLSPHENNKDTLRVVLNTRIRGIPVEIKTWFERGKGIVRQEQWRNGRRIALWERVAD
jgi:hypothetical protein